MILIMSSSSPWRIVDDCGGAFSMGTLGGGIFQAVKGFRNAPLVSSHTIPTKNTSVSSFFLKYNLQSCLVLQGLAHRLRGSANAVRIRAPQIGGEAVIQPSCSEAGPNVVACYLVILQGALPSGEDSSPLSTVV